MIDDYYLGIPARQLHSVCDIWEELYKHPCFTKAVSQVRLEEYKKKKIRLEKAIEELENM